MPYDSIAELPESVRRVLPREAARLWMSAYNQASKDGAEEPAAVAWAAVKRKYRKGEGGVWVKKSDDLEFKVLRKGHPEDESGELRFTLGVVYSPGEVDGQGDFASAETIRKAQWNYMRRLQACAGLVEKMVDVAEGKIGGLRVRVGAEALEKTLGWNHELIDSSLGDVVELYCAPCDMEIEGQEVKKGTWLAGVVWCEDMWKRIKEGEVVGYSMGGKAVRQRVEDS